MPGQLKKKLRCRDDAQLGTLELGDGRRGVEINKLSPADIATLTDALGL